MYKIKFDEGSHEYLSNGSSFMVHYRGVDYRTAEHAFQASKFTTEHSDQIKIKVTDAPSAYDAKRIAHENREFIRPDWEDDKLPVMEAILRAKLKQHDYIQEELSKIAPGTIIECDLASDNYWARGPHHHGKNMLGKIWMKLRDELNDGSSCDEI